ncbi:hypothetical protein V2J94_44930 [Streptomyces sp. DSM 41524]|uniref:Uncharacterized protein n=1 Tax=Streptomyces asiaticus subsp. ignotus TaxID=3098222 RepID=A0ABU7QEL7_9ACTN|nr:hypothetical protein [Streptomyces sp. DSM 41524]
MEPIRAIPVQHYGRYVSAIIAIAIFIVIIYASAQGKMNWNAIPDYFFDNRIMTGVPPMRPSRMPMPWD